MEKFDVVGRSSRCSQSTDKHLHLKLLKTPNHQKPISYVTLIAGVEISVFLARENGENEESRAKDCTN